jgi:hypothetical protein
VTGWYAVRAVPRAALLGCALLVLVVVTALHVWTDASGFLLPMALAATAAVSGFAFDDPAVSVTAVTPRARWARAVRLAVALAPTAAWALVLVSLPAAVVLDEPRWAVVGLAACLLAAGTGAVAAARHQPRPGAQVASAAALLAVVPLIAGPFLSWEPVFPLGPFPDGVLWFWAALAVAGVLLCGSALRVRSGR